MENIKSNTGQNLGIAAIITAIIAFLFAVIPCIGLIAIIPGIIAIVLAVVGLSHVSKDNSAKGLSIASIIIAILACLISISQIFVADILLRKTELGKLPELVNEIKTEIFNELKNENISIRIEKDGNRVNIDENSVDININSERQRILEELENSTSKHDSLQKK